MKRSMVTWAVLAATAGTVLSTPAQGRHFLLAEGDKAAPGLVRFLSQKIELAEGATQSWITLTREGSFFDPRYGDFSITKEMLNQMVGNFDKRVLGQDVFIDVSHKPSDGAAAKVLKLTVESGRLRALVEWTPFGVDAVKARGFTYLSAEFNEQWQDNEKKQPHGCVLLGAGLTIRPVIKNLDPVQLALDDGDHVATWRLAISPNLLKDLTEKSMEKYLKLLSAALLAIGFKADAMQKPFADLATKQLEAVKEDHAKSLAVVEEVKKLAQAAWDELKKLAPAGTEPQNVTITLAAPGGGGQVDVAGAVEKALAARDTAAATAKTTLEGKLKLLTETLAADKSLTPEGVTKLAADVVPMITASTTDEQVKTLAALQLKNWNALSSATKLATLGFRSASGSVHITVDSGNQIKALQAEVDKRLGLTEKKDPRRFERTGGELLPANEKFAEKVLAQYDAMHGEQLTNEHKVLAAGVGSVSDVAVPRIAERTVIREALYDLMSLALMDVNTAPFGNVIDVPFSYRDTSAAGVNGLRRYELQGIRKAGMIQTTEETRPIPQKLAFQLSSEIKNLLSASPIDYDPLAENMRNMIRVVGEDTEAINLNELAQSADEYQAVAVVGEVLTANVNGVKSIFPLAHFPVVKQRKAYDLKGVQQGATLNPIAVSLNAVVRTEYLPPADGSALANGIYWVMDYNHGELSFVDQAGVAVVPTNAWVLTVGYSYATNVKLFDTDLGAVAVDTFWDTFLYAIGARKAVIEDDRYHTANMIVMSGNVNNSVAQAKTFQANSARIATSLGSDGAVAIIKDMPVWRPRAPGTLFGDTRILVGERATSRFRMVKPWVTNPLEQARDNSGNFIDAMETFGTQWVASMTPTPLKRAKTSVILYSSSARVAR
jgi:hypothetical protein